MKKHMLPGTIALFKRLALVAIVALIFTPASIYGQCNIAQEIPSVNAPSGCSDGSFSLGSGAYYDLPISQNTYYNWTFSESTGNISGFCAAPNGTTSSGSFSANTNNWFSGDATSIRMSPNRSSSTWTGSSAVFTYRYSQPTATAIVASPNPACQGSNVTLDATASLAYFFGWSGAGGYSSSPTSNPDVVVSNVQTSGTYTLTARNPNSGGCTASITSGTVTVNPAATVDAGVASETVCQSSTPFALTGAAVGGGASTAAWSIQSGGGTLSSTSQTGSPASVTFTPSVAGTVVLRLTSEDPAGPCGTVFDERTITVNSAATVEAGGPDVVCQSGSAITLSGATFGGSASSAAWSVVSGGGTLSSLAQTGSPATITYTPPTNSSGTVTLRLTTNNPAGICDAVTDDRIVTVNASAVANAGATVDVCQGNTPFALSGASVSGGATTGAWSITGGSGTLSSTSQTASPASITFTPTTVGTVTLTLTTNDPDGAGPCVAATATKTINVADAPSATAGGPNTMCQFATITLTGASLGGGATTGAWSVTSGGTGNLSTTAQVANPAAVTFTPTSAGTITLTLTTNAVSPCVAATATRTITVNAVPVPSIAVTESSGVANNDGITCTGASVLLSALPNAMTTYAWNSGLGSGQTKNPAPTVTTTYQVTVTDANSCSASAQTVITVNTPPSASISITEASGNASNDAIICSGDATTLTANPSAMLSYVWNNGLASTQSNIVNPTGTTVYNVTVTNLNNCSASATNTVTVNPLPSPTITVTETSGVANNDGITCSGAAVGLLANPAGQVAYVWNNGLGSGANKTASPTTTTTYTVTVTNSNNCSAPASTTITVNQYPVFGTPPFVVGNVLCNGGNTGDITINGSTSNSPLIYSIDNGTAFRASNFFDSLTIGNYNLVIRDNANCQTAYSNNPVVITEPTPLSHTTVKEDASCANVFDGRITITSSGGVTPYKYSLNNGPLQSGNVFSGLSSGTYDVATVDANNCEFHTTVVINNAYGIDGAILSQTDVGCFGDNDGSVTVMVTLPGIAPYSFSINGVSFVQPGTTFYTFTGLSAGTYTATIRDSKGCTAFVPVTIAQPAVLQAQIDSIQNILCNGGATGGIFITAIGGTPGYDYLWSNGSTSEDITNITAGTYNVIVRDAEGCSTSVGATITQPLPLFLNVASANNLRCFNDSTGNIDVTASGGVPPYTFAWSNGATTEDISGLHAGTYSLTLTDNNGCVQNISRTITEPLQLAVTKTSTNVACNGASTGSVNITPAGGTTPYTFLWSNGATTEDVLAVPAGTYTVVVSDANGCSISNTTVITQPSALTLSTVVTNISCTGNSSGAIDLTVSGGAGSYTYAWTGGATTEDLSGLAPGTYTVTVTDANLCTATASGVITQPTQAINGSVTSTNVTCNAAADGTINLTVTGGVQPYSYLWSNGATTEDLTGLAPNTYSVTATDNNGCTFQAAVVISEPAVLTATITPTNVSCFGGNNGIADLTVTGGNPGYTYLWNNFATTQDLNGIPAGNYVVIVNDTKGCQAIQTVTITQPTQISIAASVTPIPCNGGTGGVNITVTGGAGSYTYLWSNTSTSEDQTGLVAGTYTVTVTDANSCTATASYTLTQPQAVALSGVVTNVTCNGAANGAVNLTVSGGSTPFSFIWSNGATTEDITGLAGGTFNVTVTDGNSCNASASFVVDEPTAIVSSIVGTNVTCSGASNGAANLTVTGGTLPYTFLWSNFQATEDLTGIPGGTYYVIITDGNGCQKRDSIVITETQSLALSTTVTNVACNGANTGAIDLTVTGGNGVYSYAWTGGGATQDTSGLLAGTYSVTVTDGNGCFAITSVTIFQPAALVLNATVTNVGCAGGANGAVDITVQGGVFPYSFAWSNGPSTEDVNGLSGGTYSVTITDANLCTVTAAYTITESTSIISSIAGTNVTCNGASNGAADLTVSGGVGPYTYLWSNFQGVQDLTNIPGGLYYVIITDVNGCQKRDSILITEPAALVLGTVVTNVACNGGNTGAIDLTVTGGTGTYTYSWTGGGATQDTAGLVAGIYNVTVTDGNGCTATATATITQPAGMVLNATTTNVGCAGGANGSVDITVQGGVFPYSFAWSNSAVTEDINGLSGGTYSVTITDDNGCTITATYTITEPASIVTSIAGTNVTCNGAANGAADLSVSGGTAPYSYFWSNFAATQDLTNIGGGTYFVIVTDANGCQKRDSVIITEPSALVLSTVVTNVLCNGSATGAVDLTVTGGTGVYTYAWTGGATTQDINGLVAGTYTVTVTDNTCTATASVVVTQPTAMVLNATTTNVGCAGGANGSVDITVQGGVFPYTFAWSNSAVTEDINALSGGTYSVTVTDANLCTITATYTITEPSALTSSISGTNVTCFGDNNGAADLTVGGGTAPYTYLWSNFFASQDLANLTAGTYFVIIKDANGCEKRDSVIITQPAQLVLTTAVTNVLCNGALTGAVDLTVTGGVGPYDYTWSSGQTTQDLTGVAAGTYTVTVKDANNCTATVTAVISQPAALVLTGTASNVNCFGGNDGQINVTVVGGVQPYTFAWSNGATTEDITSLTAGTYTLTLTDGNGCTATATYTLTAPPAITASIVTTDVLCYGASDGTANLTVGGGTPGYSFQWSNFQISEDVSGLDGGVYYVIITDANGCTLRDSAIINEPSALVVATQATQISCFNANDGSIDLSVSGGTAPYQYSWSNGATTQDISNLSGDTYCVTVTDDHACTISTCVLIINPSSISTNAVIHNPVCNGDQNGSIDVIVAGGTPNYTFNWSTGATSEDISNLAAGVYSLTITDARGCVQIDTFNVTEPSALFTSGFIRNVTCFGNNDGCVDITAYGGTLPYTYTWSTGQSTEDICNLSGSTNFVTVTDAHGCSVVSLYIVSEPAQLTLNVTGTNVSCFGGKDGTLTAFPTGGTTPYEYLWDDFNTDSARISVDAGLHVLMLTDSNGCHVFDSITLTQPAQIVITGVVDDALCFNAATGGINITVTGGVGPYNYLWSNGFTGEDPTAIAAGIYTITITDANGCTGTASFTVGQPDQIYLTLLTSKPTCNGASNGSLSVVATAGVVPYTYAWNTTPVQTTASAVDLDPDYYEVTVTDANGCTAVIGDSLIGPNPIVVTTNVTGANCFNTNDGVVTTTVSGGLEPYVYQLNGVTQQQDSTTFRGLAPGTYVLLVTDANSCQGTSTFTITAPSQIDVDLVATEQFILSNMQTTLTAIVTPDTATVTSIVWSPLFDSNNNYLFDFSSCGDTTICASPKVMPKTSTTFTVTVINAQGCAVSDTITINVSNELSAFIPTGFTPNGDGLNDRFEFDILGATNLDIKIFNRWGQIVYGNATQPNGMNGSNGWDGTLNGDPAPNDTYVWQMTITYFDGTTRDETGTVTIMR